MTPERRTAEQHSILLQAKEQQACEEVPEIKEVTGYWTRGELNVAVMKGRIDEQAAKDYMEKNPKRFAKPLRRSNRYDR